MARLTHAVTTWLASTIADFDQRQFDLLDRKPGFPSSHSRLRQMEQDGRWVVRYLGRRDGSRLRAAIPLARCRAYSWPDDSYDPCSWNLPSAIADECSPGTALLVGGYCDRRSGLHVAAEDRTPDRLRSLLVEAAKVAADEGRCLVFPYVYAEVKQALSEAAHDRIAWAGLAREAHIHGICDPDWESRLPRDSRHTLRRDRRRIAATAFTAQEVPWDEASPWAAEMIARHNARKGRPELPEFVSLRYGDLQGLPDVDLVAVSGGAADMRCIQTYVLREDEVEVYEIALTGEDSAERLALYTHFTLHLPISYARSRAIDHIRLGFGSEAAKTARGATLEELYGGVLSVAETKRLAYEDDRCVL